MARLSLVDPRTAAVRFQSSVTGITTGRGVCFDGVGFWIINETATPAWEICYVSYLGGTPVRAFGWPFTVVLVGFETLVNVHAITTDGLNLWIAYKVEYADPGPPPAVTYTDYLSLWDKDGNLIFDRKLGIGALIAEYADLSWDGLKLIAAVGGTRQILQMIDVTTEKVHEVTLPFVPSGVAYDGNTYYMQALGVNQLRQVDRDGVITAPNLTLANAGGGLCFGHPDSDYSGISDFMQGEWLAVLYP